MDTAQYVSTIKKHSLAYKMNNERDWKDIDTVLLLCGHVGIGKSTIARSFCDANPTALYFPFRNIESRLAPAFFSAAYPDAICRCDNWPDFFAELTALSKNKPCTFFFDDVDDRNDKDAFYNALHTFLKSNKSRRAFIILVMRSDTGFTSPHCTLTVNPLALHDISKRYPKLPREDMVRIYALTGGIPTLVSLYDFSKSFPDNLRSFLEADSLPCRYIEQLLSDCFRAPEAYNTLMYAMACGHHRVSEIAEFSGYASNKCDKYLKALNEAGLIRTSQHPDETGRLRTHYNIKNSAVLIWSKYIFPARMKFSKPLSENEISAISAELDRTITKDAYRDACFRQLKSIHKVGIMPIDLDSPKCQAFKVGSYTFDFMQSYGDRVFFVRIWDDINVHVDKAMFTEMENAAKKLKPFYDSYFILFAIRRFSDYCWECAGKYENLKLVQPEGLYY